MVSQDLFCEKIIGSVVKLQIYLFLVKIQKPKTYVSSKMHCEETYVFSFSILAKKNEICNFTTQGSFFQIANLEPFWPINGNKYIEFFYCGALKDSTKWGSWGITIKVIALGRHLKRFWAQNFFWVRSGSRWSRTGGKFMCLEIWIFQLSAKFTTLRSILRLKNDHESSRYCP